MYIIVIGCGRLGSRLAGELSNFGHDICVIDREPSRLAALGSGFNGKCIQGIEFDSDNLTSAGIREANALLAVSSDDNINITVSLIAEKVYHVPEIIARVNDPSREDIYRKLNIKTISPVQISVGLLKNKLSVEHTNVWADLDDSCEIIELTVRKQCPLTVQKIEQEFSCIVSGIRKGREVKIPKADENVKTGDRLICTLQKAEKERMIHALSKEASLWNP